MIKTNGFDFRALGGQPSDSATRHVTKDDSAASLSHTR